MDGVDANNDDLRLRRLSLIDFASEDDFLLSRDFNSLGIMKEDEECNNMEQLEAVDHCKIAEKIDALEKKEYDPPLLSSLEPERVRKNGKYNLRKSLPWDSAFFTSAGVLDPEELSSMIVQVDKNEKRALPMISEDIQKSSDSFSTLASENVSVSDSVALESIEGDLFEDVRASIQNSGRSIGKSNLKSKVESRQQETRKPPTSRRFDLTSQNKLKDRSASKKQADGLQAPERILKQSSSHPRSGQILAKLPSNSALSSKRPSFGHNLPAISTGGTKSAAGRGAPVSSRNTAPKVTQISTAAKKEQSTSSEISGRRINQTKIPMADEQRKRALEALERRCAVARAELQQQQQKKTKTKDESIKDDAFNNFSSTGVLGKSSSLLPPDKPTKRDVEESGPPYSTLSVAVNENLLTTHMNFSDKRGGSLVNKIFQDLIQNSGVYKTRGLNADNRILLDNCAPGRGALTGSRSRALQSNSKRSKRHMSLKQHKKCGSFYLPPDLDKFEIFLPMHEMWKSYIRLNPVGPDRLARYLLVADLHGAIILVAECKITSFTGISGIMIRETAETFGIVTKDDKFRVVPKKLSVFIFQYDCWKVTLNGDKLTSRIPGLPF